MQLEHQIAAETLLSILPRSNRSDKGPSASPENRPTNISSRKDDARGGHAAETSNGGKRKNIDDEADQPASKRFNRDLPANRPLSSMYSHGAESLAQLQEERRRELERERASDRERQGERERLMRGGSRGGSPADRAPVADGDRSRASHESVNSASADRGQPASALTGVRPTSGGKPEAVSSPFSRLTSRYGNSLFAAAERDRLEFSGRSPSSNHSSPKPSASTAPQVVAAALRRAQDVQQPLLGTLVTRRELLDHREQLMEGRKWLESTLLRTEKLLGIVNERLVESESSSAHRLMPQSSRSSLPPSRHEHHLGSGVAAARRELAASDLEQSRLGSNGASASKGSPWASSTRPGASGDAGPSYYGIKAYGSPYRTGANDALQRELREREKREAERVASHERARARDEAELALLRARNGAADPHDAAHNGSTAAKAGPPRREASEAKGDAAYRGFWPLSGSGY